MHLRPLIVSAAMGALALVLPMGFHLVGLGSEFLPLLLPLLLNGFLVPPGWAVLTGALVPLLSSLATGMPPLVPPVAVVLSLEGAVLGGVASLLRGRGRVLVPLIAAIVAGRASAFTAAWLLARVFNLPPAMASTAMLIQGLPGVALQVIAVPLALKAIGRREGLLFVDHRKA